MDKQLTTVYITKYALSTGVIKREGEIMESGSFIWREKGFHNSVWHTDYRLAETEALEKADDMRKKKIASLKKQIAKLEAMTFTIKE
ncbi:hypothetical protein [Serratia sp. 14-2641]|uniref:hypothetical protein n=1 Tax=Serratia sp. 14-2641 TaxID=1841657 RepID=UPI00080FBFE9|nr:hypothetical protein [Serratia sp. 14-2641]OCJ30599.1 hypothetical protein A6U95_06785 [Serratia sp. 14-2641]